MEFSDLILKRSSIRGYKSDPIDDQILERVLDAARLAPTAANRQPFQLIVIKTKGREDELKRIYNREWFAQAPIIICACGIPSQGWVRYDGVNYTTVDVAIVMDHLILAAANAGLGTCWIGAFNPDIAREVLNIPKDVEPIALTPIGYPDASPRQKERKSLSELVRYEKW